MPPRKLPSVKDYLNDIDTTIVSGDLWKPVTKWNRLHGDGKSGTGGTYHITTMLGSDGTYLAKVVGYKGISAVEVQWDAGSPEPKHADVVNKLKLEAKA